MTFDPFATLCECHSLPVCPDPPEDSKHDGQETVR